MKYPESRISRIGVAASVLTGLIVLQHSLLVLADHGYLQGKILFLASILIQGPFGLWIYYQVSETAWLFLCLLAVLPLSGMSCVFLKPNRKTLAISVTAVLSWFILGMLSYIGLSIP
jgi:hypothetical protein